MKIFDVIHGEILINNKIIEKLINSTAFQRLKYIKQQGNTFFLQPNAIHTRFEHSIGVYILFLKVKNSLILKRQLTLTPYEMIVSSVAALLHDIGHGPYSHCFQSISGQSHALWTVRIIREDAEIRRILQEIPQLLEDVVSILEGNSKLPVIEDILFGSLSLDQMDFWNRDLYYSSIELDLMDLNKLISSFLIFENKLIIDITGINEIEQMIRIKQALYNEGFGHPFVIGKDKLLKNIFNVTLENNHNYSSQELFDVIKNDYSSVKIEQFLALVDKTIENEIKSFKRDNTMKNNLKRMLTVYSSEKDSVPFQILDLDQSERLQKNNTNVEVIKEMKNYSSYIGCIYVIHDNKLLDIRQLSNSINESYQLPAKAYILTTQI